MLEIEKAQVSILETDGNGTYSKIALEPLERGFGITIGNALRRGDGGYYRLNFSYQILEIEIKF